MNRRDFLRASGMVGAGALLAGANVTSFASLAQAATAQPLPAGAGILVVVTLYGGNDGLNTVVPAENPVYQDRRPGLAYAAADVLPLGEGLGLNPGMRSLHGLWNQRHVAVIRGVGYPNPNHSHFASMDIWQSASPAAPSTSGWLGRWMDAIKSDSLGALSIGTTLPPMLVGTTVAGSTLPPGGLQVPTGNLKRQIQRLSTSTSDVLRNAAAKSIEDLYVTAGATTKALAAPLPNASALSTESELSEQLDVVARLIHAGTPTRVYSVSLGGFDTHADEKAKQTSLLTALSDGIARFMQQIDATSRRDDVTIFVHSEFGRRVAGNLSQGTDHGTSGPAFVIGNRVQGGFYGEQPSLTDLVNDDLKVTTDFRDIYASLIEGALHADAAAPLNGWRGRLPLFA